VTTTTGGGGQRLGATGHQALPDAALAPVIAGMRDAIAETGSAAVGVTSLAAGSDQLFARAVLAAGGQLHIVLPCHDYESTLHGADRVTYRDLLRQATTIETLPYPGPSEDAYYAAGRRVVDLCQRLLAVWDGQPARGLGGTADVVAYARQLGREVRVIWPDGVSR
jgi:hypothetical protein